MAKSRITPEQKARRAHFGQLIEEAGIKSMEDIQELIKETFIWLTSTACWPDWGSLLSKNGNGL